MRIRSISLTNVRRFAGNTARIDGIADGITVLAAPNESGKSTFFDALHALFFQSHASANREVKALQPHSGGAVTVAAEIETEDGRFRIDKTWLARRGARVADAATGRLIAQDDEAEAWIDRLVAGGLGGPAGLLWVRQGAASLAPAGSGAAERRDWESALAARRDLMSTLAGEIDAMTGGRRMDHVRAICRESLEALATATGKPKAGGAWKEAEDEVQDLRAVRDTLAHQVSELSKALAERRRVEDERARLDDPEDRAARDAALEAAEAGKAAAEAHAGRITAATREVRIAALERDAAAGTWATLAGLDRAVEDAARDEAAAAGAEDEAGARREAAESEARVAAEGAAVAETEVTRLRAALDRARRAADIRAAAERLAEAEARLAQAETRASARAEAQARLAAAPIDPAGLGAMEKAAAEVERLRAQRDALAVTLTARYDGAARIRLGDAALPDGQGVPLHGRAILDLPGIGALSVDTGGRGAEQQIAERLDAAERRLDGLLAAAGVARLSEARAALAARSEAEAALHLADEILAGIAPQGVEGLRAEVSALALAAGTSGEPEEVGDPAALADALRGALHEAEAARARREAARERLGEAERAFAEAHTAHRLARAARSEAEAARISPEIHAAQKAEAAERLARAEAELAEAGSLRDALEAAAPDLETCRAELARARGAVRATESRLRTLSEQSHRLDGLIRGRAEDGVEERLAEIEGRLGVAEARAARLAREVAALQRLECALDEARRAARDTYFEPVRRELLPLLALIHGEADLTLDDASLLPVALTRDGQPEVLDILSGGTAEQIAILTRLAFARLFARAGKSVPVILDDALVHSDDDRIERMFTALHRVAGDQQILVFTCRSRAFSRLGGEQAVLTVEAAG